MTEAAPGMVGVVLVNWNGLADTEACLASLAGCTGPRILPIVVDNASQDGSAEALARRAGVTLLHNPENLGFAAASNAGIRAALEARCRAVLLLNNDTRVMPDFLALMLRELDADGAVGLVGCRIERVRPAGEVWYDGGWTDLSLGRAHHRMRNNLVPDSPCDIDFITGCAMLVRREVFDAVGFLSDRYFMYGEDNDFCLRAARAGWRLRYVPRARVFHKVSASGADSRTPLGAYLSARNRVLLARNFGTPADLLKFPWRYGGEMAMRIARSLARGRWHVVAPTLAGIVAGLAARRSGARDPYRPPAWIRRRQALYRDRKAGRIA